MFILSERQTKEMSFVNTLIVLELFLLFSLVYSERCFHCENIADPSNCTVVETCGPDQTCSVRQFVSSDGSVLYTTKCLEKTSCGALTTIVGRRHLEERFIDVTTCYECCDKDLCNNQGCGIKAPPRDQRGPYCYTCNAGLDPTACTDVSICKENEQCITFISPELSSVSQTVYTSMCESKPACTALSHIFGNSNCPPVCCDQDFCNNMCRSTGSVQTTNPPAHAVCNTVAGYQHIEDPTGAVAMCIKIHTNSLDWDSARAVCMGDGGDLIVLDSAEKGVLLRETVVANYYSHTGYWIGARDFDLTNQFLWVNNKTVDIQNGDWDVGQPNHHDGGHDQNCAVMWRGSTIAFTWHDDYCPKPLSFICEQA